ncbi:MAG: glycosyltransferase family 2 protein [Acidobacteria bacterium]|nr:glycosyltransferase family 2 protein [Acidobacteriota bacterium]
MTPALDATVLIATYNRARLLDETLASLQRMTVAPGRRWELIVVDNNSTDETRAVVERRAAAFPAPLRYLFERQQGRSSALNTGIAAAAGAVLAFTDDDVRVADGWLDAACGPLLGPDESMAYTGGPVRPIWEVPPPRWLDLSRGDLWGTIAIQDHGSTPFVYEEGRKVPLGANMAARRSLFARVGGFRPDLGRTGGRLVLGQEVPELLLRARAAGLRGIYLPAMTVDHHIPAKRLTPEYFRRWWFGKGVSRAALERMQRITDTGVDLSVTPHLFRVPRYMYGTVVRDAIAWVRHRLARRHADAFRHEMMVAYFAGYFYARQIERRMRGRTNKPARSTAVAA